MNGTVALFPAGQPSPIKPYLLLVEDEPSYSLFLREALEAEYEVEVASDGEEAWAAVRRRRPDLIVSDILLPLLDGIALTRRLRADPCTASLPVVLITAHNRKDLIFQGLEAGMDEFLVKPFDPLELLARLRCQRRLLKLRQAVTEQIAHKEAEAVAEVRNRFFACLSHELRTPLTPVGFAVHHIGQTKGLPPSVHEGLAMIRRNLDVETRLINDLLDASQIVDGKLELHATTTDLHECLGRALSDSHDGFAAKGLKLTVDLQATRHQVMGDARRLRQVFWNLLQNAAKFTPKGGTITVRSGNEGDDIRVEVQDSGEGISAEALPKIFQPFEQGNFQRARDLGGLGLGLAIAHAVATAHEGQLTAESPGLDQGATFRVCLRTHKHPDPLRVLGTP